jgi:hypothetical protein
MCAVEGTVRIRLVPHIYKQEMYVGTPPDDRETDADKYNFDLEFNESPVNLFDPASSEKFPNVALIAHKYAEILNPGDCMYVPAFYF